MDAVLTEAVALLDEAGASALTFRALAARLGGGVASIYWYVQNKDELLDRAADFSLQDVVRETENEIAADSDPIEVIRAYALALFSAIVDRPWMSGFFLRNTAVQPRALLVYERIGQQVMRLGMPAQESFYGTSAVVGFVIGIATDMGADPPQAVIDGFVSREDFTASVADEWRALDASEFPFLHTIADPFVGHDDADQFAAGLDLILAGLRLKADRLGKSAAHPRHAAQRLNRAPRR